MKPMMNPTMIDQMMCSINESFGGAPVHGVFRGDEYPNRPGSNPISETI
jgi:hypothetical protein